MEEKKSSLHFKLAVSKIFQEDIVNCCQNVYLRLVKFDFFLKTIQPHLNCSAQVENSNVGVSSYFVLD